MKAKETHMCKSYQAVAIAVLTLSLFLFLGASSQKDELQMFQQEKKKVKEHMEVFDDLDFNVFSNQKWEELHKSHSKDVIVHWPDGRTTKGIEKHIEDLKGMFIATPDTRIKSHPIKIGEDDWTAVEGILEATFTKPMPTPDGKMIPPTGNKVRLAMVTLGHWNKDGVMDEEYLFWDNQAYMKQLGLAQ